MSQGGTSRHSTRRVNRDASLVVCGCFEEEDGGLTLVVPGGVGSELRLFGQTPGSSIETGGSGFIRVRSALTTLVRNGWFECDQTVGELRIRLGERALKLNGAGAQRGTDWNQ